jgi:UTP:GlnB (protein PII) uridylyltransferase
MPPGRALDVALEAALSIADGHQAGPRLLDHLGTLTASSLRWDDRSIEAFFRVLRYGNARSWRFLETSTVLDRVLPELAEVLRKRNADRHEMDPTRAFRWSLLERLHELVRTDRSAASEFHRLGRSDLLLLATVAVDAAPGRREAIKLGRRLSQRLGLGAAAEQQVALVCGDPGLLGAALSRPDVLDESTVLQLAAHTAKPDVARSLYLSSLARNDLETWQRYRLDELHRMIQSLLGNEEQASSLGVVERKRQAALDRCEDRSLSSWISAASPVHLLSARTDELLRHAILLQRAHSRKRFQVEIGDRAGGRWRLDIAAPDRRGLLAYTTGVLSSAGMNIESAMAVTTLGVALQSFELSGPPPPPSKDLESALTMAVKQPLRTRAIPDAVVTFDDEGSPWATLCEVMAPDREGLLHCVAAAISSSDVSIRTARVSTEKGRVVDRFELVGKGGSRIPAPSRIGIVDKIHRGVEPPRRRFIPGAAKVVSRSV